MKQWCREEGFSFIRNWRTFWDTRNLNRTDGLHMNKNGTRLALRVIKAIEEFLN